MYKTESEAKEAFCPNSLNNDSGALACLGSGCMAWRWHPITFANTGRRKFFVAANANAQNEKEAGRRPEIVPPSWEFCPADDDSAGWLEPEHAALDRRVGFCGMASHPDYDPGRVEISGEPTPIRG